MHIGLQFGPGSIGPHPAVRTLLVLACMLSPLAACAPSGEKLLARAERQLADGEYRAAMIDLRNYLSRNSDDPRARAQLSLVMLELGDFKAAEVEVNKAKALGAGLEQTLVVECRLMILRNEFQKALDECTVPPDAEELSVEMAITRGDALLGLRRYDEARSFFESALRVRPESMPALQGLGAAAFGAGGIEAARTVFSAAPEGLKRRPRYWLALGSLERQAGAFEQAEQALKTAVERSAADDNDRLSALYGLADVQLRLNKLTEAKATSDRLLEVAPGDPKVLIQSAQVAAAGGDPARARDLLQTVVSAGSGEQLRMDPDAEALHLEARMMLGIVNMQLGNLGQAEMHLAHVVARQPDNARAREQLTEVRGRLQSPEATLETLKPALARPEADPSLLVLASRLSMQSGNRDEALAYLAQAADSPREKTPEAQLEIAAAYLGAGDYDRAVELLEGMAPGGAESLKRDGLLLVALLQQGKTSEAVARADALAAGAADDTRLRTLAAATYASVGQRDRAREEYEKILKVKPADAATLLNLGRLDLQDRRSTAAAGRFRAVLDADPKSLPAALGMAAVARIEGNAKEAEDWMRRVAADHPESPHAMLAVAQFYLGSRDYGQAEQAAATAVRLAAPDNAAALNMRGLAQLGIGEPEAAIASLQEAVKKAPQSTVYRLNLGRALALQRKTEAALDAFDGALKIDPRLQSALYLAGTVALRAGQIERSAGYVERLRQVAPTSAITMRIEGDLAMAQKRYADAASYYDKALVGGGDTLLVGARYRAGRLAGASKPEKVLQDWLSRRPEDTTARILLAEHYEQTGNVAKAVEEYEEVIDRAPRNAVALNNLAVIEQRRGKSRAIDLARRAHEAAPDNASIKDTYGWILIEKGEVDRGLDSAARRRSRHARIARGSVPLRGRACAQGTGRRRRAGAREGGAVRCAGDT